MLLAPLVGALVAREFKLPASTARSVAFSSSTGNSLVVLPLALAFPEEIRGLAATAVITQTLIELVCELIYIRVIPALVWRRIQAHLTSAGSRVSTNGRFAQPQTISYWIKWPHLHPLLSS